MKKLSFAACSKFSNSKRKQSELSTRRAAVSAPASPIPSSLDMTRSPSPATLSAPTRSASISAALFTLSLLASTLLSLSFSTPTHATSTEMGVDIAPVLSISTNKTSLILTANAATGTALSTGSLNVTTASNNPTGYNLTLSTNTNNTGLLHPNNVSTIPSTTNNTAAPLSINTWGYNVGLDTTNFKSLPALSSPESIAITSTPSKSTTTLQFGAKIDMNTVSGTYTNELLFSIVANYVPVPNITSLSPSSVSNGSTLTISGTSFNEVVAVRINNIDCANFTIVSSTEITCTVPELETAGSYTVSVVGMYGISNLDTSVDYATAPSNTTGGDAYIQGTGFASDTTASIGGTACQSTKYISSSLLRCTLPSKADGNYTITTSAGTVTGTGTGSNTYNSNSIVYDNATKGDMQSFTSSTCSSLERGQAQVWTDSRNGQSYRIKKMSDGKCWMIDNLRYAYGDLISSGSMGNTSARYANPGSGTPGTSCPQGTTASTCYGYLYNWYGATAGTGTAGMTSGEATGNICPNSTNWRLPKSNSAGDYAILNTAMDSDDGTSTSWTASTTSSLYAGWQPTGSFQGVFSGSYSSGLGNQGSRAYYWSSTVYSADRACGLYFYSGGVNPAYNSLKYNGFAVRCLVQ